MEGLDLTLGVGRPNASESPVKVASSSVRMQAQGEEAIVCWLLASWWGEECFKNKGDVEKLDPK